MDELESKVSEFREKGVGHVKIGFTDIDGVIRGKYVDLEKFYRFLDLNVADWNIGLEDTITYQYAVQLFLESKNNCESPSLCSLTLIKRCLMIDSSFLILFSTSINLVGSPSILKIK